MLFTDGTNPQLLSADYVIASGKANTLDFDVQRHDAPRLTRKLTIRKNFHIGLSMIIFERGRRGRCGNPGLYGGNAPKIRPLYALHVLRHWALIPSPTHRHNMRGSMPWTAPEATIDCASHLPMSGGMPILSG